ncbi:Retrovirus-related Pol polyprotein [Arachis hypogaea]|nr:Retrovirus-related Pol polyprotein [Arachis hypogaea]
MKIFVQAVDYRLWKIILEGPQYPTVTSAEGVFSLKPEARWTEKDRKKVELNAKAVNLLNCAISFEEYRRVSRCTTAKEIWDKLQITHEGTTIVKKTRTDMLNREYEMFAMKEGESIDELFERFNAIIVGLDALGITHSDSVLVRRVLRCLTKEWETKALIISESSSLDSITLDDLRGNLLAFENTYLKKDTKKKGIAFFSVTNPLDDESSDNSSENEFVLFAKKFRKMAKLKGKGSSTRRMKKDLSKVTCYNCKELGHFKSDCLKLKKEEKPKRGKKKGLMATWKDLENDSDGDDEETETKSQTCLMADHIDQVVFHNPNTEDLHLMIDHLSEKIRYFLLENQELEQQITILKAENSFLKEKVREAETACDLVEENKQLRAQVRSCESNHCVLAYVDCFKQNEELLKEVKRLKEDLAKFTQSSESLNHILASQKPLYDKAGLGFYKSEKSHFENIASSSNDTRFQDPT